MVQGNTRVYKNIQLANLYKSSFCELFASTMQLIKSKYFNSELRLYSLSVTGRVSDSHFLTFAIKLFNDPFPERKFTSYDACNFT